MEAKLLDNGLLTLPNVSRETCQRWRDYAEQLLKWNRHINLIGPQTEASIWERHIVDSAQLLKHIPENAKRIIDFGSGGGLPGLVLALTERFDVDLVESNRKKTSFLRTIAATVNAPVSVHDERIEALAAWESDVLTARALAPMPKLLGLLFPFIQKTQLCLFLKGQNVESELEEAQKQWLFDCQLYPSQTSSESVIVAMKNIQRRPL